MNFALLGDDETLWPLLRRLPATRGHALTAAALPGRLSSMLTAECPTVRQTDQWDSLLVDPGVDAVIVAGASEAVSEAARRLASEGKPLVYWPHGGETAFAYELSLVRDDARSPLQPLLPLRFVPALEEVRRSVQHGELGRIVQVLWERRAPAAPGLSVPALPADALERALAGDAEWLRSIGGNYDRVTAMPAGVIDGLATSVTVSLGGDGLPDASWKLAAAPHGAPATGLTGDWTLTVIGTNGQRTVASASPAGDVDLQRMFDALANAMTTADPASDWNGLMRACETVDAARRSIKRRRTIDLHFEATSERSQFKTQMTAIGCGVLFLTLGLVLLLILVGSLVDLPAGVLRVARIAIFAPLFVFLLLQGLIVLARPPAERRTEESGNGAPREP